MPDDEIDDDGNRPAVATRKHQRSQDSDLKNAAPKANKQEVTAKLSRQPLLDQSVTVDVSSFFPWDANAATSDDTGGLHKEGHLLEFTELLDKINPSNRPMFLPEFV